MSAEYLKVADSTHSRCKLLYFLLNGEERPNCDIKRMLLNILESTVSGHSVFTKFGL